MAPAHHSNLTNKPSNKCPGVSTGFGPPFSPGIPVVQDGAGFPVSSSPFCVLPNSRCLGFLCVLTDCHLNGQKLVGVQRENDPTINQLGMLMYLHINGRKKKHWWIFK